MAQWCLKLSLFTSVHITPVDTLKQRAISCQRTVGDIFTWKKYNVSKLVCLFGVLRHINIYFSYLTATVHYSMFPGQFFFLPVLNQSFILTLAGQSYSYSYNPERREGKPLLPVLKTLVCRCRWSNPRPPAHEADALSKLSLSRVCFVL